ncbi:hypothetical protein EXIGLDRAFT_621717 [Exidia glandulosa HHB12029]|uniref:NADH-ubiquinone oxidoreductase B12 subunit n=1 Tax=Exidia glandulosa HHB12029 TaxID=1314781 RepID=A0A165ZXJ6_EXIGL|nr:hypothetical protein EXIGLDRAFT_621717 [Exidia glandulosa HHB12029]
MADDRPLYRDPWAKREAWRKSPIFTTRSYLRHLFPGFGIGLAAFVVYVVVDETVLKKRAQNGHHDNHDHH